MARDWIELNKNDGSVLGFSGELIAEAESGARRPAGLFLAEYQLRAPPASYRRLGLFRVLDASSRFAGQIVTGDLTSKTGKSDASFIYDASGLLDFFGKDRLAYELYRKAGIDLALLERSNAS